MDRERVRTYICTYYKMLIIHSLHNIMEEQNQLCPTVSAKRKSKTQISTRKYYFDSITYCHLIFYQMWYYLKKDSRYIFC